MGRGSHRQRLGGVPPMAKGERGIKALPEAERPRERLMREGARALSNRELLAIVLRSGTVGESALVLAERLLQTFGSLRDLLQAEVEELAAVRGIGKVKAAEVKAALELGRRLASSGQGWRPAITSPEEAAGLVMRAEERRVGNEVRARLASDWWNMNV